MQSHTHTHTQKSPKTSIQKREEKKEGTKNKWNKLKTNSKKADGNLIMSIITLNYK